MRAIYLNFTAIYYKCNFRTVYKKVHIGQSLIVFFIKISHYLNILRSCLSNVPILRLISLSEIRMHQSKRSSVRRVLVVNLTSFIMLKPSC